MRHSRTDRKRTLLLPMSFGYSSVALLHILDGHLRTQTARTGRRGFDMHVFFVDMNASNGRDVDCGRLDLLRDRYPEHAYSAVSFQDACETDSVVDTSGEQERPPDLRRPSMQDLLAGAQSLSARADLISIFKTEIIVRKAQQCGIEGIIWGDTTTALAQRILSETAKGRGFSLAWQAAEGDAKYGVDFHYPMRDLMKSEVIKFAEIVSPSLISLIDPGSPNMLGGLNARSFTIDALMEQYLGTVEQSYPSIVANVVRTAGKLCSPQCSELSPRCLLCNMVATNHRPEPDAQDGNDFQKSITYVSTAAQPVTAPLCYGCARVLP